MVGVVGRDCSRAHSWCVRWARCWPCCRSWSTCPVIRSCCWTEWPSTWSWRPTTTDDAAAGKTWHATRSSWPTRCYEGSTSTNGNARTSTWNDERFVVIFIFQWLRKDVVTCKYLDCKSLTDLCSKARDDYALGHMVAIFLFNCNSQLCL